MKQTISEFINDQYKSFSRYVVHNRAIPSVIDGFKPVNKKAFYVLRKKRDFVKVASAAGLLIADAGYNHGDASAGAAISVMAQNFPGANNIPLLLGKGSFGSKMIQEPSAPRYVYVKPSAIIEYLFKDYDLCPPSEDPENPEPAYYLPIIPNVLLNGIKGIAVGFATEIQPYKITDIIENVFAFLDGEKIKKMHPYFRGFTGDVKYDKENDRWLQCGKYKIISKRKLVITDLPTCFDRESYIEFLNKLEDKGEIISFKDKSKNNWEIEITAAENSEAMNFPETALKLTQYLNNNITVLDEFGSVKVFKNAEDLLKYFVNFRLFVYQMRIDKKIEDLEEEIEFNHEKIKFIIAASNVNFKTMTKDQLVEYFKLHVKEKYIQKLLELKVYYLNINYIDEVKEHIVELEKELEYYKQVTTRELYKIDLNALSNFLERSKIV